METQLSSVAPVQGWGRRPCPSLETRARPSVTHRCELELAHQASISPTMCPYPALGRRRSALFPYHIHTGYWLAQGHQVSCEFTMKQYV